MSVYVGKDVTLTVQVPVKGEDESEKLTKLYRFKNVWASESGSHEVYHHATSSEPSPPFGSELDDTGYGQIGVSDNTRYSKSTSVNGEYALLLFRYKCGFSEADVKKIVAKFEGYGTSPGGNGVTVKVWDHVAEIWDHAQTGTGSGDETLTITLTADLGNHIDGDGYIWVLVRTTNPSDGVDPAVLYCDYASCFITQFKFTVDKTPISDRDQDGVADEVAHVTVTKNGTEVTVSAVDDSAGLVTLASGDFAEGDVILCSYRCDQAPYKVQELSVEPKQAIEGLDALGSDTVQVWVPLLKEYSGSIRQPLKTGETWQARLGEAMKTTEYVDSMTVDLGFWEGEYEISSGYLRINAESVGRFVRLKDHQFGDFTATLKFNPVQPYGAGAEFCVMWRYTDDTHCYLFRRNGETGNWEIARADGTILKTIRPLPDSMWYTLKITDYGNRITVWIDGKLEADVTDATYTGGFLCFGAYNYELRIDDLAISDPYPPAELDNAGLIVTLSRDSSAVKLWLDGLTFESTSLSSQKSGIVFAVTPFRAKTAKITA